MGSTFVIWSVTSSLSIYLLGHVVYQEKITTNDFVGFILCMVGLYDLNNHLVGVMGISFIDEHNIVTPEWIFIRQKVGVIGTLLSEYLYPNNK